MAIKLYEYKNCSTCKKALMFLEGKNVKFERVPIVDQPPTMAELKTMLAYLKADGMTFKNLFNASGLQYRELDIAARIKTGMTDVQALKLLSVNGKLIKRPFLLTDKGGTVGFKPHVWEELL